MKVLVASDSFKGSLSSQEVGEAVAKGIRKVYQDAVVKIIPIADGGEGTVEALSKAGGGKYLTHLVTPPLGEEKVNASIGMLPDKTAVIEMAAASGITLVDKDKRNPLITTTKGTGELVKFALDNGAVKILLGIGGSATNDGGAGFAEALGVKFLNKEKQELAPGGLDLINLDDIDISGLDPRLKSTPIIVICDVDNPLCGPRGASAIYGPQKGATPEMVEKLDKSLNHYAKVIKEKLGRDIKDISGAGAAGGLGGGLKAFTEAEFKSGIEAVLDFVKFDEQVKEYDLVITGEGKIDAQSVYGKAPQGVASKAQKHGKPVIAIAGSAVPGAEALYDHGVTAIVPLVTLPPEQVELDYAIKNASSLISEASERSFRLIKVGKLINF